MKSSTIYSWSSAPKQPNHHSASLFDFCASFSTLEVCLTEWLTPWTPDLEVQGSILFEWFQSVSNGFLWQGPLHHFASLHPGVFNNIIPRARIGYESIAHEAKGRMGYWLRGHEGKRNNCFSKIRLVGQNYQDKITLASIMWFSRHRFGFQSQRFPLLVGYNIKPSRSSTNQNAALIIDH